MSQTYRMAVLAVAVVLVSLTNASAQQRQAAVLVDSVDQRRISDTQPILGRLAAIRRSDIATRIAGVVGAVSFQIGDRVRQGNTLVALDGSRIEIEKRSAEATVAVAQAGVEIARAKLKLAEQAFDRQAELKESTAFSRSRFDDLRQSAVQSRSELGEAQAKLQSAKVGLDRANYELRHTKIVAPFDGIAIARQAQPGQYVQAGGTVVTLLDINNLEIAADVPGQLADGLRRGTKVEAVFENGTSVDVFVRTAIPLENRSTRTRPVRFKVELQEMKPAGIAVGGNVTLKIPVSAPREVVTVAKDALLRGRDGWMVFVVEDDKVQPRPVVFGQAVGDRMEIKSGLKQGEIVVVRGNERLRPGQAVKPKHVAETSPQPG